MTSENIKKLSDDLVVEINLLINNLENDIEVDEDDGVNVVFETNSESDGYCYLAHVNLVKIGKDGTLIDAEGMDWRIDDECQPIYGLDSLVDLKEFIIPFTLKLKQGQHPCPICGHHLIFDEGHERATDNVYCSVTSTHYKISSAEWRKIN